MDTIVYSRPQKRYLGLIIPSAIVFALLIAACVYFYLSFNNFSKALAGLDTQKYEADIEPGEVWEKNTALIGKSILELNSELAEKTQYIAPNGLKIESLAGEWRQRDLVNIYKELLKNEHGDELDYLAEIVLKPDDSVYGDFAGEYQEQTKTLTAAVVFSPLIDAGYINFATLDYGRIYLYNMNDYDEVRQIAETLSHEYGHHYTFFHFFADDDERRKNTEYYALRGLSEYPDAIEYTNYDEYLEMHAWDISEIAAEDYVQFLGSDTGKEIGEYMDIKEALYTPDMEYVGSIQTYHYNVFGQENPVIPLAEQVEGLEDYFFSFIEEDYVEQYTEYPPIVIEAQRKRSRGKTHYILTWNALELNSDSEVIYTVVCYNRDGSLYSAVKTISGEEELSAVIGTPTRKRGSWIYWWNDGTMDEDRILRVVAYIVDEGIIIGSEPYYADF